MLGLYFFCSYPIRLSSSLETDTHIPTQSTDCAEQKLAQTSESGGSASARLLRGLKQSPASMPGFNYFLLLCFYYSGTRIANPQFPPHTLAPDSKLISFLRVSGAILDSLRRLGRAWVTYLFTVQASPSQYLCYKA
jgi:hypothetical protein